MTTYATAGDYANFLGLLNPDWDTDEYARINAGLLNAQADVDAQIYFSTYDPADAAVVTALTRATCARFEYIEETGDSGVGTVALYDNVKIGSVSLGRHVGTQNSKPVDPVTVALGPKAATILRNAGLVGSGVVAHS